MGPLFEDNNSLGARDMGLLPDTLPGYRPLADASTLEGIWGTPKPPARAGQKLRRDACWRR